MVKISERLRTAAGLHRSRESRLADVGTDHGYVPIYLVERKHIPSAIAMDIRTGPAGACQGTHRGCTAWKTTYRLVCRTALRR